MFKCVKVAAKLIKGGNTVSESAFFFLFNDALNTFYLRLYGIRHMVKDHSDSERETCCDHMD